MPGRAKSGRLPTRGSDGTVGGERGPWEMTLAGSDHAGRAPLPHGRIPEPGASSVSLRPAPTEVRGAEPV